jgi:hypothetical protein
MKPPLSYFVFAAIAFVLSPLTNAGFLTDQFDVSKQNRNANTFFAESPSTKLVAFASPQQLYLVLTI